MPHSWTAAQIVELARAFQPMCILAAAAELDVFAHLTAGPLPASRLARTLGADERATTILLDALAALELLEKGPEGYRAAQGLSDLLTDGGRGSVLAMVRHQANCLRRWSELAQTVRSGRPAPRRPSIRGEAADYAAFVEAMDNVARPVAGEIVGSLGLGPWRHVLDVGGASGSWTIAFLESNPRGRATLFDLPHVIPQARARLGAVGLLERVELVAGDYNVDRLPGGCDLAWVSAIVHQHSREQNRALFANVRQALEPGGRIVIRDVVMEESRTAPVAGALFAVNMLSATEGGGTFTLAELTGDLESSGLGDVRLLRRDEGMHSVVEARVR
jgi:precorrin-6B methylase 2